MSKPLRCRIGLHAWVRAHPPDERLHGPDHHQICTRCQKQRGPDAWNVPPGILGS